MSGRMTKKLQTYAELTGWDDYTPEATLRELCKRYSAREIAFLLQVSDATVRFWRKRYEIAVNRGKIADGLARLGYASLDAYFLARSTVTQTEMADELGVTQGAVQKKYADFSRRFISGIGE